MKKYLNPITNQVSISLFSIVCTTPEKTPIQDGTPDSSGGYNGVIGRKLYV